MKSTLPLHALALLVGTAIFAGCSKPEEANNSSGTSASGSSESKLSGEIKADGSSTVGPASMAIAEEFGNENPGVKVAVNESGTGGGFKKFSAKEIDIAGASRPIKKEEMDACAKAGVEFIELPIAFDGLTVLINKENTFAASLTVDELKKMWAPGSTINNWKDVRAGFPDLKITYFGAGTDSGTFDYFTKAIVGEEKSIRKDYQGSEDDNVTMKGIQGDKGAIGFIGYSYFSMNKDAVNAVAIDPGTGAIAPSESTIQDGTYQPLGRPLFIYVAKSAAARPEVKAFVEFYLSADGHKIMKEEGFVPLPDAAYDLVRARFAAGKTGTAFGGETTVGVKIEDILAKEK